MKLKYTYKSPKRYKPVLVTSLIALSLLSAIGLWYVFIAGAPQLDARPVAKVDGLNFQTRSFHSDAMDDYRRYGVVLPPGYNTDTHRRYPVIVMLHGGHGDEMDYQDKAGLTTVLDQLYRSNQLPPAIVITPDGNDLRGSSPLWDPEYYNGSNGDVATLIASDLVQEVKTRYRTLEEPKFWAIGGLSSGGWGAFNIGLRHLNQFQVFFSHTGYFKSNDPKNSPIQFIQELPAQELQKIHTYLDAGQGDATYLDSTKAFHEVLQRLKVKSELRVFPGGHGIVGEDVGWNYWRQHLKDSLEFVGHQFHQAQFPAPQTTPQTQASHSPSAPFSHPASPSPSPLEEPLQDTRAPLELQKHGPVLPEPSLPESSSESVDGETAH